MDKHCKLFALIMFTALFFCTNVFAKDSPLQAIINVENNYFSHQKDIHVSVTIINTSNQPVKLLQWFLPQKRLDSNVFVVTRDGLDINYQGRLIKRAPPTENDYLILEGGKSYTAISELSSAYDMQLSGNYEIQLAIDNLIVNPELSFLANIDTLNINDVRSNKVSFWVEQSPTETKRPYIDTNDLNSSVELSDTRYCSNNQRNQINSAESAAKNMVSDAYRYLTNGQIRARYTTWFGRYSNNRHDRVKRNFSKISNAINTKPVLYDCSCNESYYAYVYPNDPYNIYLCNAFWSAPRTGTDSKAGTIIHELSHFTVVAGTDDVVYGHQGAKELARTSPNRAVRNADSHEYFAENTPNLP